MSGETHGGADPGTRFARLVYRWRIVSTLVVLALVVGLFVRGIALVGSRTNAVVEIADVSDGRGSVEAQIFDPSLDVWFAGDNDAIATYDAISDRFIAEDYLLVSFEVVRTETLRLQGREYFTYVVENQATSVWCKMERTLWYAPELGVIVKEQTYISGDESEHPSPYTYELSNFDQPKGSAESQ